MNGDDFHGGDRGLPILPDTMPLWHRVLCVLGYHKPEVRIAPRRINSSDGSEMGPMRMRDACGRCGTYLNGQIPIDVAKQMVAHDRPDHEWVGGPKLPPVRERYL